MSGLDLLSQAREFAQTVQDLLNKTVCNYAQVNALTNKKTGNAHIGTGLSREDLLSRKIEMRTPARTKIWLDLSSVWFRNDEGYLTAQSSYYGIYLGADQDELSLLVHYDYERGKDLYTEAHIQVAGRHPALEQMLKELGRNDHMEALHFPVGGRRLRPSLEDLLECLIAEGLVDPKPGYKKELNRSRRSYREKQIAALVRSNQETAAAALRRVGWTVTRQEQEGEGILASFRKHNRKDKSRRS